MEKHGCPTCGVCCLASQNLRMRREPDIQLRHYCQYPPLFEPEWEGYVTIEISNTTPLPAKIYAGEGIAQVLFFEAMEQDPRWLNTIIIGDAYEVLSALPDQYVDLVITSPPYNLGREYKHSPDNVEWQKYFEMLAKVWEQCYRILKPGGRIAVNVQPNFSSYVPTHHIVSEQLRKLGFLWKAEIIWDKHNYRSSYTAWGSWRSPSMPYFKYTWEFVEIFSKGSQRKKGKKEWIDISGEEFKRWVNAKWDIAPERKMKEYSHPAMFPEELPHRLIKLLSYQYDIVLDPFNGVGTTTVMAWRLRRFFVGIDISSEYCKRAYRRIMQTARQLTIFDMDSNSPHFPLPRLISFVDIQADERRENRQEQGTLA